MHIFVIGGSGRTGQLVIKEALERGHTITALVRSSASLQGRPNLKIVTGNPLALESISNAINSTPTPPTAVIITLNARRATDNPWSANVSPPRLMADTVKNTVTVMRNHKIRRLIIMSAFGVGDSWQHTPWLIQQTIKRSNMLYQYEDHDAVDREVKALGDGLDWTLVRPVMLKESEKKGVIVRGETGQTGTGLMSSIGREDVAEFLLIAAEASEWIGKTPVITN